ncbi:hypothetical protein DFH07DRAFT_144127 [Mycena maculata]|uniref:Uncharacterized protein n=1 Tax=Mycena maculata TaxID=230809 RepID=A0AAD7I241_9AGAR|nr:hypothetical protein DFH07DRAFT_144127 [Mycena maculata]
MPLGYVSLSYSSLILVLDRLIAQQRITKRCAVPNLSNFFLRVLTEGFTEPIRRRPREAPRALNPWLYTKLAKLRAELSTARSSNSGGLRPLHPKRTITPIPGNKTERASRCTSYAGSCRRSSRRRLPRMQRTSRTLSWSNT